MADAKISALADIVTLAAADKVAVADASDLTASKSATMTEINDYLQTLPLATAQITALGASGTLQSTDTFPMTNFGVAKEATFANLLSFLQANGLPRIVSIASVDYTNNSTTGTEITELSFTGLTGGVFLARWTLFVASDTTSTSFKFGVNHTGAITRMMNMAQFPSAGVNAATGTLIDVANATTGQILAYANSTTESSTAPNLGPWVGVTTINVFHRIMVETIFQASTGGDLELWAASEVGASTITVKFGSSGTLIQMQ